MHRSTPRTEHSAPKRPVGSAPTGRTPTILAATLSVAVGLMAIPARAADNDDLQFQIDALIGTHNAALPFSFLADPVFSLPASAATFATNLKLKDTRAVFETPGDWAAWPNAAGGCRYAFDLPQSQAVHSDILGIISLKEVPADWGNLTGLGGPVRVYHANTGVDVHVRNPFVDPNRTNRQSVELPSGIHDFEWRAESQISTAFDIVIPAVLLTFNSAKYIKSWKNQGWKAARHEASKKAAETVIKNIALNAGLGLASQAFETRTSVVHSRDQAVTIWKSRGPRVSTDQPEITLEATDFGGVAYTRVADQLAATVTAGDPCDMPFLFGNDAPPLLPIGDSEITWTARDWGPLPSGGFNSDSVVQRIVVEDTQGPIIVAPPSRVIEVPSGGLDASEVLLGTPRVVDLADPAPLVVNDGPGFYPIGSRSAITWTATDASGNGSQADQLVTVKAAGTNTAPTVSNVSADTLTSQPVDVVLRGQDGDFLDGRFDPLSFRITQRPGNGEFIAPLLPFFIEDYRTQPGGPYGDAFILSGNQRQWLYQNVCQVTAGPDNDKIARDWVHKPLFVHVTDEGLYVMIDYYFNCGPSNASQEKRISFWDADGNYLDQINYGGSNDTFVVDQDSFLYTLRRNGGGSSTSLLISQSEDSINPDNPTTGGDSWRIRSSSASNPDLGLSDFVQAESLSYGRVDTRQGLLYVTDRRNVFVFDVRNDLADGVANDNNDMTELYRGALNGGERFLCTSGSWGSDWTGFAMDVDPDGNLYVADSCTDRIHKFAPTRRDEAGEVVLGDYVGWLGRCETSTNNACDEDRQVSKGYSCTDATCGVGAGGWAGIENGQFSELEFIALDPNGVLYATDQGDPGAGGRVQRFATDGTFGGVARSTGTGINQGEQPGFVLGNLGTVRAVSVNSTQFFVVDQAESFVHVFETSPLKNITDDSVTVTYVSDFDFHGQTDTFEFVASDGLADSNTGTASVRVARNFRAPVARGQAVVTVENQPVDVTLTAEDPDGIEGIDFNGLDVLTYRVISPPRFGSLAVVSSDNAETTLRYTPDPDAFGEDRFAFVANDGVDDSEPAEVAIEVTFVDDPPKATELSVPPRVGLGFPTTITGAFVDDGATGYTSTLMTGDGSPPKFEGEVVDEDTQPRLDGIVLIEPLEGRGTGRAVAQHTWTRAGAYPMTWCVADQLGRDSCTALTVDVLPLVNVGVSLPEGENDDPPAPVVAGEGFFIDVTVGNLEPDGSAGLVAQAITMEGTISGAGVTFVGASEGSCQTRAAGQAMRCDFGDFAVGEERTIRLHFASDASIVDDDDAAIDLEFTTASDSVNETMALSTVRTIESVIMIFRDEFEPR